MNKIFWSNFTVIIAILFFSLAIFGVRPVDGNNVLYVPYMEKIQNGNLFPNDILFDSFRYHLTLFYNLIPIFSNFLNVSIKDIMFWFSLIIFFFIASVSFLFAQFLFKNRLISIIFLIFLMGSKYSLAYEAIGINLNQATQTTFVLPFGILAFLVFLKKRKKLAFFIIGLLVNIQPIISFQIILILTFSQIIRINKESLKTLIRKLAGQYLAVLLGSLPILTSVLILKKQMILSNNWFSYAPEWFEIVKLRISHHFLPSKWGIGSWLLAFIFLLLFCSAIKLKKMKREYNQKDKVLISILLSFIPVFFLGSIGEIVPIPIILLTEIFRVFVFYNFFCLLYSSYFVYKILTNTNKLIKISGVGLAYFLFLPTSTLYNFQIFKPSVFGTAILSVFFIILIIFKNRLKLHRKKILFLLSFSIFLFFTIASCRRLYKNYKYWGHLTLNDANNKEWIDAQIWANKNTDNDAVFLVPPNIYGFRVYSRRSIVSDFKGGASLLFHPFLYKEWAQRMYDLGVEKTMVKGAFLFNYKELNGISTIYKIAHKYQANYLVSSYNNLALEKLYANKQFTIYKLN